MAMKLADIDDAVMLRNHRQRAIDMAKAARSGPINVEIWYGGEKSDPFSVISAESVRDAIVRACERFIGETEAKLWALGVTLLTPRNGTPSARCPSAVKAGEKVEE